MSTIAVDFLLGRSMSSRAIAYFGQGANGWSHCASVLADGRYLDARDNAIAGVPPGVHIRKPDTEAFVKKCRASLEVTAAEYADWEANLRAKITTEYDRDAILGFLEGRSRHTSGRWICSALAINAVQHIRKVPYPLPVPAHEITPNACLLILAAVGFTIGPLQTSS